MEKKIYLVENRSNFLQHYLQEHSKWWYRYLKYSGFPTRPLQPVVSILKDRH